MSREWCNALNLEATARPNASFESFTSRAFANLAAVIEAFEFETRGRATEQPRVSTTVDVERRRACRLR